MTSIWARELAEGFWRAAGIDPGDHTSMRRAVALALPLTVVSLPRLRVAGIDEWLHRHAIPCSLHVPDRPLRACLVAQDSHGAIFLDGTDPEDEQRFSLAHEVAHFLHDYWEPRQQAAERYGDGVLEVFDGVRPARPDERIRALLALIPVGYTVHLMDRGGVDEHAISAAERDADALGFEILAPADEVLASLGALGPADRREAALRLLTQEYGLPIGPAERYARLLVPEAPASFVSRLRVVR
jgi:hypothetical protein